MRQPLLSRLFTQVQRNAVFADNPVRDYSEFLRGSPDGNTWGFFRKHF